MAKQEHPWVQDANSYEAVLCCLNNVHDWDQAATIRAYQTFGFDDASTPGNDQSYRHEDTGVMVLHDGDVVAIQFGDGNLVAALGDLFRVLSSLGWQKAEVYHPPHTMGALLTDMGNAIPAHMDFDVTAAKQDSIGVSQLPEAVALVERGRSLLQGVVESKTDTSFHELALGELQSMDETPTHQGAVGHTAAASAAIAPIALDDDEPRSGIHAPVRSNRSVFLDDETEPMVPLLGNAASMPLTAQVSAASGAILLDDETDWEPASVWPDAAPSEEHTQQMREGVAARAFQPAGQQQAEPGASAKAPSLAPVVDGVGVNSFIARAADTHAQRGAATVPHQVVASDLGKRIIYVGTSALCFSEPGEEVTLELVTRLSDQLGAVEVVNVWPGLIDQCDRWDVLGEVDLQAPWTAQLLVQGFGLFDAAGVACFAADLMQSARSRNEEQRPQLRDVTQLVAQGKGASMSSLLLMTDIAAYQRALLELIAGLAVAGEGSAFVDVRGVEEEGRAERSIRPITIRALMQDAAPKLYVIHRDAIDGPFVLTMVRALREVAAAYASSVRSQHHAAALLAEHERQAERDRLAKEEAAQRQKAAAEILKMMSGLKSQLQTLGVEVPEV